MLTEYKPKLDKLITIIAKPFVKINPNILTFLGVIPPILFFIFLLNKNYLFALLMFLGLFFDTIDGAVARITNKITPFGGFLDSSMDRISDFLLISAFGFSGIVKWEIIVIVAFLSFLVSYLRSRGELAGSGKISLAVGIMERTERIVFLVLALLAQWLFPKVLVVSQFNISEVIFIIIGLLTFITALQRIIVAYHHLKHI